MKITVNGQTIPIADRYEFVLDASDGDGRIGPVSFWFKGGKTHVETISVNGEPPHPYLTIGTVVPGISASLVGGMWNDAEELPTSRMERVEMVNEPWNVDDRTKDPR